MSEFTGGWDSEGNYHDPDLRLERQEPQWGIEPSVDGQDDFYHDRLEPYRQASELNGRVVRHIQELGGYTVDSANRDDIAVDIAFQNGIPYEVVNLWRSVHGGGLRGEKS